MQSITTRKEEYSNAYVVIQVALKAVEGLPKNIFPEQCLNSSSAWQRSLLASMVTWITNVFAKTGLHDFHFIEFSIFETYFICSCTEYDLSF